MGGMGIHQLTKAAYRSSLNQNERFDKHGFADCAVSKDSNFPNRNTKYWLEWIEPKTEHIPKKVPYMLRKGSASVRIAAYKACSQKVAKDSTILKAIDDAIRDGVDILSVSLGMKLLRQTDFLKDPISIGALHANQAVIVAVCSARNDRPDPCIIEHSSIDFLQSLPPILTEISDLLQNLEMGNYSK
ncbi:hypothetical protein Ancab_001086 [Ancistrocladus abbreviatus]